ncbi:MAG: hypothetical protein E7F58_00775 [Clostridium saudiense]|jgi:hypothetical protein|nr:MULTISPECIES: hypothetical protein [Clostridium]MDU3520180.1 hypothetical protein [Clostridium saudiense]CUN38883.1 Uncharacterised protein [Clostridium disporicum]
MDCKKLESLKQEIKTILKDGEVTAFVAITILNEVKRDIEAEALSKKL